MVKEARINEEIRAKEVRLISKDGEQIGIVPLSEAMRLSAENELDLVEVAAQAEPPVCRIMDYGKYRYQQNKRERDERKKHRTIEVKEIRMRPSIDEHDYQFKLRHTEKFLGKGDRVKVTVMFRGREMSHTDIGRRVLERLSNDVGAVSKIEREVRMEGRYMTMIFSPK